MKRHPVESRKGLVSLIHRIAISLLAGVNSGRTQTARSAWVNPERENTYSKNFAPAI